MFPLMFRWRFCSSCHLKLETPHEADITLKKNQRNYIYRNKLDQETYVNCISSTLSQCDIFSTEKAVEIISPCLKRAANQTVPLKTLKFKGPKRHVSGEVL